ncbi:MAG TPA: tetratricopeptide repeat protein [Vicinamibacterales bacterium]|nr:tetratricopeptide repeat protein [Vicinamibacterales bacterium]
MTAHAAPAGIPEGLTPDELERWCNELAEFLTSPGIPEPFRAWARAQAERIDAYLATASELEPEAIEDEGEEIEPAPAPPARPRPSKQAARRRRAGRPSAASALSTQGGKLLLGVAAGVVALAIVFGARELAGRGSSAGELPRSGPAQAAFDEARAKELEALLQTDPSNRDALFELGEMNFQAGRYEEAIAWFTKLVEVDPSNVHALTDIGTANFNLGRPEEAKTYWLKALEVDPNDAQVHYNLGFLYANVEPRDLAAAIAEWEKVIELAPGSRLAETARVHVEGLRSELTPAAAPPTATPGP